MRYFLVCFFLICSSVLSASDRKALALLEGVVQERSKCKCFRICYTEHRAEENKTVEQVVEFDNGKIRKNHIPSAQFQGMMSLFVDDVLYRRTDYNENRISLVSASSSNASAADIYDLRLLGITDVMNLKKSIKGCLILNRQVEYSVKRSSVNGISVWQVTGTDIHPDYTAIWDYFIEEPGFRILRMSMRTEIADIVIDNDYSNANFLPFPTKTHIFRKEGKETKEVVFDRTITVKEVDIKTSFPQETFTLSSFNLPLNTTVSDYRIHRRIGYWDGEKLVDDPVQISAKEVREIMKKKSPIGIVRIIGISIGVALILLAVCPKIWGRKKKKKE
ncbi:MAG: hypothetical protein LBT46_15645 [Planctomycetaceae bacterium]|nr:hypothetical protein [Planctomycetaceae bacterium]